MTRRLRVLVVEPNASLRGLFVEALYRGGLDADGVGDAAEALAAQARGAYDVVVTEQHLPLTTGVGLTAVLNADAPRVPVIVCAGPVTAELRTIASRAGVAMVLEKPFPLNGLVAAVRAARAADHGAADAPGKETRAWSN